MKTRPIRHDTPFHKFSQIFLHYLIQMYLHYHQTIGVRVSEWASEQEIQFELLETQIVLDNS